MLLFLPVDFFLPCLQFTLSVYWGRWIKKWSVTLDMSIHNLIHSKSFSLINFVQWKQTVITCIVAIYHDTWYTCIPGLVLWGWFLSLPRLQVIWKGDGQNHTASGQSAPRHPCSAQKVATSQWVQAKNVPPLSLLWSSEGVSRFTATHEKNSQDEWKGVSINLSVLTNHPSFLLYLCMPTGCQHITCYDAFTMPIVL